MFALYYLPVNDFLSAKCRAEDAVFWTPYSVRIDWFCSVTLNVKFCSVYVTIALILVNLLEPQKVSHGSRLLRSGEDLVNQDSFVALPDPSFGPLPASCVLVTHDSVTFCVDSLHFTNSTPTHPTTVQRRHED